MMPQILHQNAKKFLVQYDGASILRTRNGYGFIEYYNYQTEKTTSG